MYQQITIVGNLGSDPELRSLPSGTDVCNFSVATSRRWRGQDGENRDETIWFRVAVFGRQAQTSAQYLQKGRRVLVAGRLSPPRAFIGNDGQPRASLEITAQDVRFLSGRDEIEAEGGSSYSRPQDSTAAQSSYGNPSSHEQTSGSFGNTQTSGSFGNTQASHEQASSGWAASAAQQPTTPQEDPEDGFDDNDIPF